MSKEKTISAGVLLKSRGKYLLAHPTELTGTTHGWGIPKGKLDGDETAYQAAIREFYEETNLRLFKSEELILWKDVWCTFKVGSNKKVHVFRAFDTSGHLFDFPFKCISFIPGHAKVPEIDKFQWIEAEDALDVVTESQLRLFSEVLKRKKEEPI